MKPLAPVTSNFIFLPLFFIPVNSQTTACMMGCGNIWVSKKVKTT
jgi:hypothetical protein